MTFYHLGNCLALAYGPYILTYKYFELSEYGAFWKCVQAGGIYFLTELCKMLILATFFPSDMSSAGSMSVLYEFLKATVDLLDLIGLSIVMRKVSASGVIKVVIAGLGWSTGHFLLSEALPLWVGARGLQFDWQYMLSSLQANVVLVHHLSLAALVLLWHRLPPSSPHRPTLASLALSSVYLPPLLPSLLTALLGALAPEGLCLLLATALPRLALAAASFAALVQVFP